MSKNILLIMAFAILAAVSCNNAPAPTETTQEVEGEKITMQNFGAEITADKVIGYDDLLAQIATSDSVSTKFKAKVNAVCKKKGCWATVSRTADQPEMFVKFKDYAFFLPLDCEGQEIIMEGVAYREVTPVDELRHYAEDEGKSKEEIEAITEPEEELKFMATGVLLLADASK